jgi:hypothetical protein
MMQVEVFGEFTDTPWATKVPCHYDQRLQCFKARVSIKVG